MKLLPKPKASGPAWRRIAAISARWLFFLGSVLFLIHLAYRITNSTGFRDLQSSSALVGTALAALIISLASFTSTAGWNLLLEGLAGHVGLKRSAAVYCTTQIAKYLPGNFGHYLGRVALAKTRLQIPAKATILSLLQETGLTCLGALLVGLFCYFFFPNRALYGLSRAGLYAAFVVIAGSYLSLSAVAEALRKSDRWRSPLLRKLMGAIPKLETSLRVLPFYIAGYVCIGIAVSVIGSDLLKTQLQDFVFITGAYSLAWIIGFLIPGAPGGLGVRESALVLLLAGTYPKDMVLMLALLARLASVGADLLTFFAGLVLVRTLNSSKSLSIKNP